MDTGLYNADIFSIDKDAKVDHIKNVRRIIASYLENAYEYSYADAYLLATFITYYNAVHRGEMDFFSKKYKPVVLRYLNRENAGIARRFDQWPGNTRVVIPLVREIGAGPAGATELSDKKVIETLREQKDKGIPERKEMVEFREKEVKKQEEKVSEIQDEVDEKEEKLRQKKEEIEQKKEEISEKERQLQQTEPEQREERKQEIEREKEELARQEREARKEKQGIEEQKQKIEQTREQIEEKKEAIEQEKEQIQEDRERLKKEEEIAREPGKTLDKMEELEKTVEEQRQKLQQKQEDKIFQDLFYYLKRLNYTTGGHYDNEMVVIDAETRMVVKSSPLKTISGRNYALFERGIAVIARENRKQGVHHLVLLDREELKPISIGRENVFWRSFVEQREGEIFTIIMEGKNFYLARYNEKIEMTAKSSKPVYSDTFVSFYKNFIYVNAPDKRIMVLDRKNLEFVELIKP
jgi:hypothetical protein